MLGINEKGLHEFMGIIKDWLGCTLRPGKAILRRVAGYCSLPNNRALSKNLVEDSKFKKIDKKIKTAWIVGTLLGVVCLCIAGWQPAKLGGGLLLMMVSYGIYIKSRICAIIMLISNIMVVAQFMCMLFLHHGLFQITLISLAFQIVFFYVIYEGIRGVFVYHSSIKKMQLT